jgi:ATP-dependent Clp protease protease subunit
MIPQNEFMTYATKHLGMSSMHLENYANHIGSAAAPNISNFTPNVIEERSMNIAARN